MKEPVSSTQYRFSYQIRSAKDFPADFHLPDQALAFETGIFLPQDHSPDPRKGNTHPARIFLLIGKNLKVFAHPTACEAAIHIDIHDLQVVELGRFLLLAWVKLSTSVTDHTLFFNSESGHIVDRLLKEIRRAWLPENTSTEFSLDVSQTAAAALTFKFQKRLNKELDIHETVRKIWFIPPEKISQRNHLFRKVLQIPGDLLAITSRRVLWITDRERSGETRELYGSIARYAPLSNVAGISLDTQKLRINFQAAPCWSIPIRQQIDREISRTVSEGA